MKTKITLLWVLMLLSGSLYSQSPNVVIIIADDMGWSQVSTPLTNLNNPSDFYETPTLATLASEGIAFPHAYVNGANCAPTRAALLSGQYASRPHNNIWAVDNLNRGGSSTLLVGPSQGLPNGIDELPVSAITIAETMKTAGYATVHLGKFHVGENESTNSTNNAATDQGFDFNYGGGTKGTPGSYFASSSSPYTFHANIGPELDVYADPYTAAESLMLAGDNSLTGTKKHVTDAMADAAIDWMEANKNTPFFMHFSNFAIHGPFDTGNARPDLVAKYQAKPPSQMGHNSVGQAAIAEGMDQTIGRLVDYLKTTDDPRNPGFKLSENTLVYFISDNGGARGTDDNGPLKGMKGELHEGGIRSVTLAWSEAPWLANKGTVNHTPIVAFDLYPTLAEMAGASLPGGGYDIDGASQWQMLTNGTPMTREAIYWHFPGYLIDSNRDQRPQTVIRKGDYKLIHSYETASYEMYNLINDMSETTNLLAGSPDQATLIIANDLSTDMQNHLINISAPLPTYRSNGQTVPLPYIISTSGGGPNSQDGCQATAGYSAYWDFDTATNTDDASGNGHNAVTIYGTPSYDTSDFQEGDQSIVFDGATEILYSDGTFLNTATTARTVAGWIKPTVLTGTQEIFEEGGSGNGLALRLNGSSIEASLANNQGGNIDPNHTVSAAYPTDGDWHHIALVFDGSTSTMSIYIDGVLANSTVGSYTELAAHSSPSGIGGVLTGDAFGSATGDSFFTGKMDALSVYDTALSLTQIEEAACVNTGPPPVTGCAAPTGYEAYWNFDIANGANDASGNNHNPQLTPSGAITYDAVDFVEGDQSIVFDGTEAIRYATNNSNPDTFMNDATSVRSVVAWIKPTALSGIQDIYDEGGKNVGIAMRLNGSNLESIVRSSASSATTLSAVFPNDGAWHHVALVYDGTSSSHKLYIDGVEVDSSSSASASIATHFAYGGIGGKLSGNDSFVNPNDAFFTGKMDAFAMYNSALSLAQVEEAACLSQVVADAGPDVTICDGDSTTLTASGGDTYLWSTGATTASINVSPTSTTVYTVTAFVGGNSDDDSVTVTVNPLPTADAGADVTICDGDATTLTATGGDTYLWSTGATTASINVSPSSTTVYSVTVTTNGCSANDDVTVTVNPTPTANAGADVTICEGDATTLTATGGDTYLWSTGATTASINVSPSSTTVYTVTVTTNGCSDNDSVTVNVDPLPMANAGADVTICDGDSTTLTASGGDTYLWSTGATTASINVSPNSTTVYTVTVTTNGCSANDDVTVTVNPAVIADAGPDATICDGDSTTLIASGGDTYLWSTGATTSSISVSPSSTTVYTVTVTTNGCSDDDTVTVNVDPTPTANAGPDVAICEGDSTTLTATGGDTYLWSTGATTASINVSPSSTTVYSVTVTNNGCSANDDVTVTVNTVPVANAGQDVTICDGDSTTLTASGGDTYLWSTGATTASINVSPNSTTVYTVTATSNGCSDNDTVTVNVDPLPTADAGADATICEGDSTTLTASGGDTYLWSTGATTASINVSPSSTTVYTVTVTSNGCSANDSVTVNVNPLPNANAGPDVGICNGDTTTLTASGGDTYLWSTGATTASINVSPGVTTVYTVTVTTNGCSSNDSVTVTVGDPVVADAGPDATICDGDSTTLTASGGDTYLWNTGATTASINVSPSSTTVYTVTVTTNGCSDNDSVTVNVDPTPTADAGPDVAICEGDSTTLTASGGDTYLWSTGATTASINVSPSSTTVYSVTVTSNGCSDNDSVTVTVNAVPVADAGPDVTICDGDSTTLTASGGDTYLWNTGATTASINVSPSSTTVYTVTVTSNGCSDNDSVTVNVDPTPTADAGPDVTICEGDATTLTASGGDTYLWSTGATTASINVSPSSTTVYSVTVTSNGCSDNDSVTVNVNPLPTANAGPDVAICGGDSTTLTASGGDTYLWSTGATTASIDVSPSSTTVYSVTVTSNGCSSNDDVTVTVNTVPVADAGKDETICDGDNITLTATGGDTYLWSTGATTASIIVSPSTTTVYTVTATSNGCSSNDSVTVNVDPTPTANAGPDVAICDGDSTTLTASGGDTYLWSTGATTSSINVSPSSTTVYSVTVTSNGCSDNDSVTVTVNAVPVADAGPDVTICDGDSTTLTATGGDTYLWNTGATTASINVSPSSTTVYSVTVTSNGCSSNDSVTVNVNPTPTADAGPDVTITEGDSTTLTATGGGTYLWSTGATTASINVSPTSNTTYTVTVTSNGCSDQDSVIVTVESTGCTYSVINSEGFESGWGIWNDGGSDARRSANDANYATTGTYAVRIRDNTDESVITTDDLDLTAYEELTVDFGYYARSMDNSNEDFWLQISTDGGANYTLVEEWNRDDEFINNTFNTGTATISGPFTANTRLRFRCDASGNSDWIYLDDIVINGCSSTGGSRITAKQPDTITNDNDKNRNRLTSVLYPNPFENELNIRINEGYHEAQVEVFNMLGQQVFTKLFRENEDIKISMDTMESGQYFIRMRVDDQVIMKRAIKK